MRPRQHTSPERRWEALAGPTMTYRDVADTFDMSESATREGVRKGALPLTPLKVGRRSFFLTSEVKKLLGIEAPSACAEGIAPAEAALVGGVS